MMRFSEAIRLGAVLYPQCFGTHFSFRTTDDGTIVQVGLCAVGGALQAIGFDPSTAFTAENKQSQWPIPSEWLWTISYNAAAKCPSAKCPSWQHRKLRPNVVSMVMHLNDLHHWSITRIADWVESIEPTEQELVSLPVCTKYENCLVS